MIAAMTPGFSGADLANIINEATLLTVRRNKEQVGLSVQSGGAGRGGVGKKNRVLNKMERERIAHHEVGHALVALSFRVRPDSEDLDHPSRHCRVGLYPSTPDGGRFLMAKTELENKSRPARAECE
jgi:cell division protease FtsH